MDLMALFRFCMDEIRFYYDSLSENQKIELAQSSLIFTAVFRGAALYFASQRGECVGTSQCNGNALAQTQEDCERGFMERLCINLAWFGTLTHLAHSNHMLKALLGPEQGVQNERYRMTAADVIQAITFWALLLCVEAAYTDMPFLSECQILLDCETAILEKKLAEECTASVEWGVSNIFFAMLPFIINASFTFPTFSRVVNRMLEQHCQPVAHVLVTVGETAGAWYRAAYMSMVRAFATPPHRDVVPDNA